MYLLQKTLNIITCLFLSSLLYTFSDAIVTRISVTQTPSPTPKDSFADSRPAVTLTTTSNWPNSSPSPSRGTTNTGNVANDDRQSTSKSSSESSARPSSENPTKNVAFRLWTLDAASLYVNGVKLASIDTNMGGEVLVNHPITIGDVISIRTFTTDPFDGGIALSVKFGFSWYVIGHGFVRSKQVAVTASDQGRDSNWMLPAFKACTWKPAVTVSTMDDAFSHMLRLRGQLDYDKTEYRVHQCRFQPAEIIQSQQGRKDILQKHKNVTPRYSYHRIVVGGDKCGDSVPCLPGKCLWLQDNFLTTKEQDGGQAEQQNDGKKRCRCRQEQTANSQNRASCFTLTGKSARWAGKLKMVCKKRDCFPKYECVSGWVADAQWCIIKYASHRTKALRKWYGDEYLCENEKLNHTEPFLAPYE